MPRAAVKPKKKLKKTVRKLSSTAKRKVMIRKVARKVTRKLIKKAKQPKPAVLGKVVHYYDRIGVAIVDLARPVRVGDMVRFLRGSIEFVQPVVSLQIQHQPVVNGKKGDVVGMKVQQPIDRGAFVFPA